MDFFGLFLWFKFISSLVLKKGDPRLVLISKSCFYIILLTQLVSGGVLQYQGLIFLMIMAACATLNSKDAKIILKPSNEKFDIQICIPAYKRENELEVLFQSIRNHLDDVDYNLYFLLNGANENVKKIVLEKLAIYNNTGVVIFEENIKDGVFTWPFFNLPQGLFWVVGDDDLLTERSREAIKKAIEYDLTILNYDLYDNQLKKIKT